MRVYVAGKWELRDRVQTIMHDLTLFRHVITYDWTVVEQESSTQAVKDAEGVQTADVLVLIAEEDVPYAGALVELGIAIGCGIPVFVLGNAPITRRCIFMKHPLVYFIDDITQLIDWLKTEYAPARPILA